MADVEVTPFKYDAKTYKDFHRAKRHVIGSETSQSLSLHPMTLSSEDEARLRKGVGKIDMDYRWEGNASVSTANKAAKEVVVRLYRTWTSHLVYEARYRPNDKGTLTLYEFAYESDDKIYRCGDPEYELSTYKVILYNNILELIKKPEARLHDG